MAVAAYAFPNPPIAADTTVDIIQSSDLDSSITVADNAEVATSRRLKVETPKKKNNKKNNQKRNNKNKSKNNRKNRNKQNKKNNNKKNNNKKNNKNNKNKKNN